jgi:type VI secretion system ImpM family protein
MASPLIGLFGKLPSHPDFVRLNAGGPLARVLDTWMQEGLSAMRGQLGNGWEATFDRAAPVCFAFRSKDSSEVLTGICRPGRDQGGRRYPFLIFAHVQLGRGGSGFHVVPQGYAVFLKAARRIAVVDCADGIDNQKAARIMNLASILPQNLVESQQRFDRYLNDVTMESFWRGLYGDFQDRRKYLVIKNVFATLAPRRGHEASRFGFAMKMPTSSDPDQAGIQTSTWFRLCQAALGGNSLDQSILFWTAGSDATATGCLLFFRPPTSSMLLPILVPDAPEESIWDMETMGSDRLDSARDDLGEAVSAALDSPHMPLKEFVRAVQA